MNPNDRITIRVSRKTTIEFYRGTPRTYVIRDADLPRLSRIFNDVPWPAYTFIGVNGLVEMEFQVSDREPDQERARTIKLTQGKVALVDGQDYERVSKYKWYAGKGRKTHYALRNIQLEGEERKILSLHRFIMNPPDGLQVDHINMNGLDCRRSNMRLCTIAQNQYNRGLDRNNTSGYKGVSWRKDNKKWLAQIRVDNKNINLGCYDTLEEAARTYDKAAREYFGKFARVNFPINPDDEFFTPNLEPDVLAPYYDYLETMENFVASTRS